MYNLRRLFLLDPSVTYLNHGSFGATPKAVFDEYQRWQLELERQPVEFLGRRFAGLIAESRAALGAYLGTHTDNLVYTQNVTISLNIVARSLDLGAGDEVLSTDHEYGAMDRTWRFLAKKRGFTYLNRPVLLTSKEDFIDSFWSGVTPRTRVIFLSHITSPTALILPVREIIQRARTAGILTVIDGAHVAGQIPLNLDSLGADFYGGNLHKWLCAPKGAGFLYARPEVQNLLKPLVVSWGYEPETPGPSAFVDLHEWWGTRDIAAFLSVPAAIQFQQRNHWEDVRAASRELAGDAQRRICELTGIPPIHSDDASWFSQMSAALLPVDTDIAMLKSRLYDEYRIEVPLIEWNKIKLIRVSIQGYNSSRDANHLLRALTGLLKRK
ncbi:MAG: aminotransferase class V-fold PLP-dependent enzyme [Chloroflexi bacterium]|nr:aminotransferase class V-fold PLP-dependent enzyme [Chloroflexota bacterium]